MRDHAALEPLFVFDRDGELYVEAAGRPLSMEAIDVLADEYEVAFGLDGEVFRVVAEGRKGWEDVSLWSTGAFDLPDLDRRLRAYVARSGLIIGEGDFPIEVANAQARDRWGSRWPTWPRWVANRLWGESPQIYSRPAR